MIDLPRTGPLVVYDTEYTAWEGSLAAGFSRPGEHREVVQIGAVRLDTADGLRETGALSLLVRPSRNPILSAYFIELTGLTQHRVDSQGGPFVDALGGFRAFCDGARMVLANGTDDEVIAENCRLNGLPPPDLPFVDAGPWISGRLGEPRHVASWSLAGRLGLDLDVVAHDALDDARVIAAALRRLLGIG